MKEGVALKLLFVSQHYYPDNFRINDIAEKLAALGHDITVLTSLPDYTTGRVPKDCRGLKNRKLTLNGVKVIRTFSFARRKGLVCRALNYISFLVSSTIKVIFLKEKFDAVIAYQTSPILMANAANAIAKKQKIPFLLYCLDLWPECLKAWNVGEKNILFKILHSYSKMIYGSADLVAVSSEPFMDYLQNKNGTQKEKILYLPQHSMDIKLPYKEPGEVVKFAFGGNLGSVQNIECILNAVSYIKDLNGFKVEIYGSGSQYKSLKELAKNLDILNVVKFFGRVDMKTLHNAYKNVDAFLLTLESNTSIGLTLPAKVPEYMSANRPIFASIDGAAAKVIKDADCGAVVESNNAEALAKEMEKFIKNPKTYKQMAENGKKYFDNNFTLDIFIKKLISILNQMIGE